MGKIYECTIDKIMETSNLELYKLIIEVKKKLLKDRDDMDTWCTYEKNRMPWKKKLPLPLLNFPELVDSEELFGYRTYGLGKRLHRLDDKLEIINQSLLNGTDIEKLSKRNFCELFRLNMSSISVCNYIIKNILDKSK